MFPGLSMPNEEIELELDLVEMPEKQPIINKQERRQRSHSKDSYDSRQRNRERRDRERERDR